MFKKPILLAIVISILVAAPVSVEAYEWAIQLNGPQLMVFAPRGQDLSDLLNDSPMAGSTIGMDFDVFKGLHLGFDFAGLYGYRTYSRDDDAFDEDPYAALEVASTQVMIGARYGYRLFDLWTPWAGADFVPEVWRIRVYDQEVDSANDGTALGVRFSLGSDFFPFYWASSEWVGGIGFTASMFLDFAQTDTLGVVEDVGGWGICMGFVYRFPTFGEDETLTEEKPTYIPPVEEDIDLIEIPEDPEPAEPESDESDK